MKAETLIKIINERAENNRLFWVAGLARETWQVLINHIDELHEVAKIAVLHYAELKGE